MRRITLAILVLAAVALGLASCDNGTTGGSSNPYAKKLEGLWEWVDAPTVRYEIKNDYLKRIGIENGKEELTQSGKIIYYDETKFMVDLDFSSFTHLVITTFTYSFDGSLLRMANGVAPIYTYKKIKN